MIQEESVLVECAEIETSVHRWNHKTFDFDVRLVRIESYGHHLWELWTIERLVVNGYNK